MNVPHAELWVGYARHKITRQTILTGKIWTRPLTHSNRYAKFPPLVVGPDEIVYQPNGWAHTEGTPKVHPNEQDWEFVLVRFQS